VQLRMGSAAAPFAFCRVASSRKRPLPHVPLDLMLPEKQELSGFVYGLISPLSMNSAHSAQSAVAPFVRTGFSVF
jgi:hypothetical protein